MFRCLNLLLLLLFCFIYQRGAPPVGTSTVPVSGKKGDNVTLPCTFEAKNISYISLNSLSENIPVCQNEECSGRVFKQRNCDIVFKDLCFSDAGTYFLHVYYNNDQAELKRQFRTYQLNIHDEISVKTGEELKLDVLLSNADKVEHLPKTSTEWTEVWKRGNGVHSTLMSNTDGNLIIKEFTPSDAGTYRVLDFVRNILITVAVTESGTDSKGKLNYMDADKPNVVCFWTSTAVLLACICFWILWFWNCFHFPSSRNVCL